MFEIPSESFYPVIVVGGGTCGLAVTARLCEGFPGSLYTEDEHQRFHWLKQRGHKVNLIKGSRLYKPQSFAPSDILVLDAVADKFTGQWDNQFAACQIPYLRSPMFFHPDPVDVDALVCFAHRTGKEDQLKEIKNVVGKEISKHKQKKLAKKNARRASSSSTDELSHNKPGIIDINMRDWKDYYRPSTPLFKEFCSDVVNRYNLHDNVLHDEVAHVEYLPISVVGTNESGNGFVVTTKSGRIFGCKACIIASGHRGDVNYPIKPFQDPQYPLGSCHTTHLFNNQVKFLGKEFMNKPDGRKGKSIVIVGGGLTSAQLAHVAVTKGISRVYLLMRGGIKIKHFDFHLDWVTKYKNVKKSAFYIRETDEERYQMIQDAREGGSVNPEYYKLITSHAKAGTLNLLKNTTITSQEWDSESSTWNLTLTNSENDTVQELAKIDYIYFATGIQANINSLDFLKSIRKEFPIPSVHGFPCLTDNLQWTEDVPLFMLGKNASIRMGPSSANLDGARLGAERIGWFLQDALSKGELDWSNDCECCDRELSPLDISDTESVESEDSIDNSYETRYKLATNQINPFSLLVSS